MKRRISSMFVVVALAALFWIVPSVGTQGMGTIGHGFTHADSDLIDPAPDDAVARDAVRNRLQHADTAVEVALGY